MLIELNRYNRDILANNETDVVCAVGGQVELNPLRAQVGAMCNQLLH